MKKYTVCGYDMKLLHNRQLQIAKEVFRICEENGLKCSLYGGSIIGAVRHQGFVPWDHDIDLCMPRKDYEKLFIILKKNDNPLIFLSEYRTEKRYPNSWAKVRLNNTVFQEKELESLDELHNGVFVDLHPIDNVYKITLKIQVRLTMFWTCVSKAKSNIYEGKKIKKIIYKCFSILPYTLINWFRHVSMSIFKNCNTKYVYKICHPNYGVYLIERTTFEDLIKAKFENECFYIPRNYDQFLRKRYGDYMKLPPESEIEECCSTITKCVL